MKGTLATWKYLQMFEAILVRVPAIVFYNKTKENTFRNRKMQLFFDDSLVQFFKNDSLSCCSWKDPCKPGKVWLCTHPHSYCTHTVTCWSGSYMAMYRCGLDFSHNSVYLKLMTSERQMLEEDSSPIFNSYELNGQGTHPRGRRPS